MAIIQRDIERDIGLTIGKDAIYEYIILSRMTMEVAKHEDVNKLLQCNSYFCNAYHSWGKGMVENNNGLIRRFLPKGTDFDNSSEETIQRIENRIKEHKCT